MERFNKTIKKIAALTGGAVMVGAAMAGALAALDDLPQPFVTSAGVFDAYVVVGTMGWNPNIAFNAAAATGLAQDVSTGIDVGAAFAQTATSSAGADGITTSVSEGVLIASAGQDFNYDEDIDTVMASVPFDDGDLPDILADGNFKESKGSNNNDEDYEQTLEFTAGDVTLLFDQDENNVDTAGTYLYIADGDTWTYTVEFDNEIDFDGSDDDSITEDFDGARIVLQGKSYTITSATEDSANAGQLGMLEMISGSVTVTQGEYTTQTYTVDGNTYEVEVVIISDSSNPVTAKFKINGETTDALSAGDTYELSDGMEIGIDEVLPNEGSEAAGADQVTFYLGAQKLELEEGSQVKINGQTIDDWTITADFNDAANELTTITVTTVADDDLWLDVGDEFVDPVFGAWKFVFGGLEKTTEDFAATAGGDDGELSVMNVDDEELEIPFIHSDTTDDVYPGDEIVAASTTSWIVQDGQGADNTEQGNLLIADDNDGCFASTGAAGDATNAALDAACDDVLMLAVNSGGEARILQITDLDSDGDEISIKDLTSGGEWENKDYSGGTVTLGGFMDIGFADAAGDWDGDGDGDDQRLLVTGLNDFVGNGDAATADFRTSLSGEIEIDLANGGTETQIEVFEDDGNAIVTFDFDGDGAPGDCIVDTIAAPAATLKIDEDSDIEMNDDGTGWGALVTWDGDDKDDLTVEYPEEQVIAEVYITPTGAVTTTVTSGAVNVNYINAATGISRTDQDFATAVPTKNVILIGGPTVHELVSDLATAGSTWTSEEWADKADTAIVQLVENAYGSNDALVIAGYAAKDTALAGKVVASRLTQGQFSSDLTGSLVEINTAGASTVNEVTFA